MKNLLLKKQLVLGHVLCARSGEKAGACCMMVQARELAVALPRGVRVRVITLDVLLL